MQSGKGRWAFVVLFLLSEASFCCIDMMKSHIQHDSKQALNRM